MLGAALLLGQGCGKSASVKRERPTLAVFKLKLDQLRLPRGATGELQHHARRMLETSEAYRVVPADKVNRALRRHRRRRRRDRHCYTVRCQARLGRRLHADRSLALQVTKNLVGQCDVIGKVYDLERKEVDVTGRARAGCAADELRRSVDLVLCHILSVQGSARRKGSAADGPARVAPPRECLARAEFLVVDDKLEALLAPPKRRRRRRPDGWEQQMAEQVLQLKREYDGVVQLGVPRWAVAATCRSGRLYEHYARKELSAASGPVSVRQQRAAPFVDKARELYQSCLDQARQLSLEDDRYTAEARTRLEQLPAPLQKK